MAGEREPLEVLRAYPPDCWPNRIEPLGSAGGFSGAHFWRLLCPSGVLCLRRWPRGSSSAEHLEFIQAVLRHVVSEGFELVPLARPTRSQKGYVRWAGHLWELSPWISGRADFSAHPSTKKLEAAMQALARFHLAAAGFCLPKAPCGPSPGLGDRLKLLRNWLSGQLAGLAEAVQPGLWPELEGRAASILRLVPAAAGRVLPLLEACVRYEVPLQPCIRDIWHRHVLFEEDRVSGLIDFGSMALDNVAADVARLLGSMARDDRQMWRAGLEAYCLLRPMTQAELSLVRAFDQSTVVLAGLNWIDWIYRQRRVFEDRQAIPGRLDEIILRLEQLSGWRPWPTRAAPGEL